MANQWFRFKKFTVHQDKCAMKVGTDGVLLGAWTELKNVNRALDIGCGTGLIALMLAQRSSSVTIDALEIDTDAATQAKQNVADSIYSEQIHIENHDFNDFVKSCALKYDLILSNPPFFQNSLKSENKRRALARHSETLTLEQILSGAVDLLTGNGRLSLILPAEMTTATLALARRHALFPCRILHISPIPGKEAKRVCIDFSFHEGKTDEKYLIIEDGGRHQYSTDYIQLTGDFYLNM